MNTNDNPEKRQESSGSPVDAPAGANRKFDSASGPREIVIGVTASVIAIGLLIWVASGLFNRVESRGANGVVIGKEIVPRSETEFTLGAGGLKKREVQGEHVLRVRVPAEDRVYRVWVTESVFNKTEVGSPYMLVKTPLSMQNPGNQGGGQPQAGEERGGN